MTKRSYDTPKGRVVFDENAVWYLDGEPLWVTRDGYEILLKDMSTNHLRNCLANIFIRENGWRRGYLEPIAEELKKRTD